MNDNESRQPGESNQENSTRKMIFKKRPKNDEEANEKENKDDNKSQEDSENISENLMKNFESGKSDNNKENKAKMSKMNKDTILENSNENDAKKPTHEDDESSGYIDENNVNIHETDEDETSDNSDKNDVNKPYFEEDKPSENNDESHMNIHESDEDETFDNSDDNDANISELDDDDDEPSENNDENVENISQTDEEKSSENNNNENKTKGCESEKGENNHGKISNKSKMINILLLGETGVGKSTWINGFVNYLTYDTLDDAVNGDPVSLIPSEFTVTDAHFNEHTIKYGVKDKNEETENAGQSATQMPKTYVFNIQDAEIRIMDTPGIGDTRGIEKDKENMQNIMTHLSHYKELNGIIILLKPNNSRINVMFSFCVTELLTHLHKDACKNIVICFTNARSTFYRPGDTLPALKKLLTRNQSIDIKLTQENVYCMDNEPVRFLMALKTIEFSKSDRQEYATSWGKAVDESLRLIDHISSLPPHSIQKTLSINEVRRSIIEHSRPMALIAKAIETNIDSIKDQKEQVFTINSSKKKLLKKLKVSYVNLKVINLKYPRTVCTSSSCVSKFSTGNDGTQQIHYKTICHSECSITTEKNVIRCAELQKCAAMDSTGQKCEECSCPWYTHMHITYETVQETVMIEDETIKELINSKSGKIKAIRKHKKDLNLKLKQLNNEKQRLAEVTAKFACFLKHNAIAPYNDAMLDYLNHLIEEVKFQTGNGSSSQVLVGLENLKGIYQQEVQLIEDAMKSETNVVESLDVKKINDLMKELKTLPHIGVILTDMMQTVTDANDAATKLNEDIVNVNPQSKKVRQMTQNICSNTLPKETKEQNVIFKIFGKIKNFVKGSSQDTSASLDSDTK